MATGKKTGGKNWKKGQSGNDSGAPYKWETYSFIIQKYDIQDIEALRKIKLEEIPIKEAFVIQQMIDAYDNKSLSKINWFAERSEGKAIQRNEHTGKNGDPISTTTLSKKEYEQIRDKMIKTDEC